jgi:hypothetical protein
MMAPLMNESSLPEPTLSRPPADSIASAIAPADFDAVP